MGLGTVRTKAGQMVRERFADLTGVEVADMFGGGPSVPSEAPFADQTSRFRTNGTQAGFMRVNRLF